MPNPLDNFARALGGAAFGNPRLQALGQLYGQRSAGQTLKNQQLQTEISEHDALMKGLANDPEMIRSLQAGEDYSSAKFNLGKSTIAENAEKRLVEGLANLDPNLVNQVKAGLSGTDIRALENIANDKSLNLAKVGEVDARTALDTQKHTQRGTLSDLLAGEMMKVPDGNGGFNQVPANILLPYLSGMTGAGSSSLLQTQEKVNKIKAQTEAEKRRGEAFKSLKEWRDSKKQIANWKAELAKTKYGKHGLKSKEFLAAVKDAIKMFMGGKNPFGTGHDPMSVEYKGQIVDARSLNLKEITEVAENYVLGLTGELPTEKTQPQSQGDLTNALGGESQVPQAVVEKLSGIKGKRLEDLYQETRNLPDGDPLRDHVEKLYLESSE